MISVSVSGKPNQRSNASLVDVLPKDTNAISASEQIWVEMSQESRRRCDSSPTRGEQFARKVAISLCDVDHYMRAACWNQKYTHLV